MKSIALLLSIAAVALAAPVAADAGQGHGRGHGNGGGNGRGGGWGDGGGMPVFVGAPPGRGRDRGGPPPVYYPAPRPVVPRPGPAWRPRQDSLGAGWREQQNEARSAVRQGRFMPLSQVLPRLRQRLPGRQLDAGIEQGFRGQPVYRVRWAAANGRRVDFIVDARTGAILGAEGQ